MFDSLTSALKELAAEDLREWSDEELDESVLAVAAPEAALAA